MTIRLKQLTHALDRIDWSMLIRARTVLSVIMLVLAGGAMALTTVRNASGQQLEVRLTQTGFAGEVGKGWRVDSTGVWVAFRIADDSDTPYANGKLAPAALEHLKETVKQYNLTSLPNELGGFKSANPEILTIRLGSHSTVLTVRGGTNLMEPDQKIDLSPAETGVVAIANAVRTLTAP